MPDVLTPQQRKKCMSNIRSRNTTPEIILRKALWHAGLRYRLQSKLPGKPDIVFPGSRLAIFVDGCFWHACPIHGRIPESNISYWKNKIFKNATRDILINKQLEALGWQTLRYWEHSIPSELESIVAEIQKIYLSRKKVL